MVPVHHWFEHRLATDTLIGLYAFVYQQAVALLANSFMYDNVLVV